MKETRFKQTEIGEIPEDWEVKKIEPDLGIVKSGKRLPKGYLVQDVQTNHPYIRVIDMEMGHLNTSDIKYVPNTVANLISQYKIFKDDIYISVAGTLGIVGKIPEYLDGANLTENANRITNIKCNRDFLLYYLMSDEQQKIISSSQTLGAQPKLALYQIRNFLIPLPPTLEEQTAIAKALSDVDNVISTLEKLIAKKKNIKQGTMQELLTGKKRLPGFAKSQGYKQTELGEIPKDWEMKRLGEVFTIKHGYGFKSDFFSDINNKKVVVTPGNFKLEGGFQYQNNPIYYNGKYPSEFNLIKDDLVVTMTDLSKNSDTLGNPMLIPNDGIQYLHNQRIGLIHINGVYSKNFIFYLLCTEYYHSEVLLTAAGSTVKHTSPARICEIKISLPSTIEEQTAIAEILSNMDKEIDALNKKLQKYRAIKTGMMQQLLTGKIRLM